MSRAWYTYNGADGLPDEGIVGNYSPAVVPTINCVGGSRLCQVYALYDGSQPQSISQNLKDYSATAKINNSFFPTGANKPYVYTRPA